ncbi:MAG: hypothetical protein J6D04_05765 [Clostridia bacterium]|nr:hypothetical protein [Clostridia bacterium]
MNNATWKDFVPGRWQEAIDVRDFIQLNYTPYTEGPEFLSDATPRTKALMEKVQELFAQERAKGGVLDIDTDTVSSLVSYAPGYVDKEKELIVGLQTDAPIKRSVNPFGGLRMVSQSCKAYGYE